MEFHFKPFYLDTNAYFGSVIHDKPCNDGIDVGKDLENLKLYQTSLKRALYYLNQQGNHSLEEIFNKLTRNLPENKEQGDFPRFTFFYKKPEESETLWQYLTSNE